MTSLTKSRTWQYLVNQRVTQTSSTDVYAGVLLAIKNGLKSGTFTTPAQIIQTCNAVTVSSSDNLFSITDFVWGSSGTITWFTMKFPGLGTNYQVCFSCSGSSSRNAMVVAISPSAGFTGGTTSARPTATDEVVIASTWAPASWLSLSSLVHIMQSSDGKAIRVIVNNNGLTNVFMMFDTVGNTDTWWTIPVVAVVKGGGTNQIDYGSFYNIPGLKSYASGAISLYLGTLSWAAQAAGVRITTSNSRTSKYIVTEMGVASETASPATFGVHGKMVDLWWGPSAGTVEGQTAPEDGSYQYVQFGHMVFPWNGTLPVVS